MATCTFNTAGSYNFLCGVATHVGMTGTIVVEGAPGGPPPGGGGPPPGGGGGGGGGSGGDPPGSSPTQPGSPRINVARRQTGTILRGSVTTAAAARIVVTALVSNRLLSQRRPKRVRKVSVGSQTKRAAGAGKTSFAVKLNAAARRALARRGRLAVRLRIAVTSSGGAPSTSTVRVTLRAR